MKVLLVILSTLLFAFGMACLEGWLIMLLLNWLLPILGLNIALTFWQTMGAMFLINLLFGRGATTISVSE